MNQVLTLQEKLDRVLKQPSLIEIPIFVTKCLKPLLSCTYVCHKNYNNNNNNSSRPSHSHYQTWKLATCSLIWCADIICKVPALIIGKETMYDIFSTKYLPPKLGIISIPTITSSLVLEKLRFIFKTSLHETTSV